MQKIKNHCYNQRNVNGTYIRRYTLCGFPYRSKEYRQHYRHMAQRVIIGFKQKPCADCQDWFEPCQMDFDHVRGVKRFDISKAPESAGKTL